MAPLYHSLGQKSLIVLSNSPPASYPHIFLHSKKLKNLQFLTHNIPSSLEGLTLKLKLQYFGHLMWRTDSLEKENPDAGKDWSQEEKGATENKMVGWHYWLDGHEFEQAPRVGDG